MAYSFVGLSEGAYGAPCLASAKRGAFRVDQTAAGPRRSARVREYLVVEVKRQIG